MGRYAAGAIKSSYSAITAYGGTSTADALETIYALGLTDDPADPDDALRSKAIVLITDGEPNSCGELPGAVAAAEGVGRKYDNGPQRGPRCTATQWTENDDA